ADGDRAAAIERDVGGAGVEADEAVDRSDGKCAGVGVADVAAGVAGERGDVIRRAGGEVERPGALQAETAGHDRTTGALSYRRSGVEVQRQACLRRSGRRRAVDPTV